MVISSFLKSFISLCRRYINNIGNLFTRLSEYIIQEKRAKEPSPTKTSAPPKLTTIAGLYVGKSEPLYPPDPAILALKLAMKNAIEKENTDEILQIFEKNPTIFKNHFDSGNIFKVCGLLLRPELQGSYSFSETEKILEALFESSAFSVSENSNISLNKYVGSSYIENIINLYHTLPAEEIGSKYEAYIGNSFSKTKYFSEEGFFETIILLASEPARHEKILQKIVSLSSSHILHLFLEKTTEVFKSKLAQAFDQGQTYDQKFEKYRDKILTLFEVCSLPGNFFSTSFFNSRLEMKFFAAKDSVFSQRLINSIENPVDNFFHSYAETIRQHARENFVKGNENSYIAKHSVEETILRRDGETLQGYIANICQEIQTLAYGIRVTYPDGGTLHVETFPWGSYLEARQLQIYQDCCSILFDEICKIKHKPEALEKQLENFFFSLIKSNDFELAKTFLRQYKHDTESKFIEGLISRYMSFQDNIYNEHTMTYTCGKEPEPFFNILLEGQRTKKTDDLILENFFSYKRSGFLTAKGFIKFLSYFVNKDDEKYSEDLKYFLRREKYSSFSFIMSSNFTQQGPQFASHLDLLNEFIDIYDMTNITDPEQKYHSNLIRDCLSLFPNSEKRLLDLNGKIHPHILKSLEIFKDLLYKEFPSVVRAISTCLNLGHVWSSLKQIMISARESDSIALEIVEETTFEMIEVFVIHKDFNDATSLLKVFEVPERRMFLEKWLKFYSNLEETEKSKVLPETLLFYMSNYLQLFPNSISFEEFSNICSEFMASEEFIFCDKRISYEYISNLFKIFEENPEHENLGKLVDEIFTKINFYGQNPELTEKKFFLLDFLSHKCLSNDLMYEKASISAEKLLGFSLTESLDGNQLKRFEEFMLYFENLAKNSSGRAANNEVKTKISGVFFLFSVLFKSQLKLLKESRDFASFENFYNIFLNSKKLRNLIYPKNRYLGASLIADLELELVTETLKDPEFLKTSKNFVINITRFLGAQIEEQITYNNSQLYKELCDLIVYSMQNEGCDHILESIITNIFDAKSIYSGEFYLPFDEWPDDPLTLHLDYCKFLEEFSDYFAERYLAEGLVSPEVTENFYHFLIKCANTGAIQRSYFRNYTKKLEKLRPDELELLKIVAQHIEIPFQSFLIILKNWKETSNNIKTCGILFTNFTKRYEPENYENSAKFNNEISKIFENSGSDPKTIAFLLELCALHDNPSFLTITLLKVNFKQTTYLDQYFRDFLRTSVERFLEAAENPEERAISEKIIKIWVKAVSSQTSTEIEYNLFLMASKEINKQKGSLPPLISTKGNQKDVAEKLKNEIIEFLNTEPVDTTEKSKLVTEIKTFSTSMRQLPPKSQSLATGEELNNR